MDKEYLKDTSFLKELDKYNNKFYYVKIIVLDMDEKPIRAIEGRVEPGSSLNIDGSSAVRRTCSLSFVALEEENDLTDIDNLLSINKKVKIEVGIKNSFSNKYDNDIFWFPQGIFVVTEPDISHSESGCSISITCKDKMALLNGECGGNLPASVTFHEYDQVLGELDVITWPSDPNSYTVYHFNSPVSLNGETSEYWQWSKTKSFFVSSEEMIGEIVQEPNLIYDIIQTLVCNYGGESIDKIIINDVPLEIKQLVRNISGGSIFYNASTSEYSMDQNLVVDTSGNWVEFQPDEDCGYIYTDFVYPGELVSGIGENICSVLDEIKDTLGNYEYFYDIDGNFVFQEIKNYLNVSYLPVSMAKTVVPLSYTSPVFNNHLAGIDNIPTNQERINYIVDAINNGEVLAKYIDYINNVLSLKIDNTDIQSITNEELKIKNYDTYNLNNNSLNINSPTQSEPLLTKTTCNFYITYPLVEGGTDRFLISYVGSSWQQINNLYIINDENYLVDYDSNKKSIYNFDVNDGLITSINNSPDYENIKNDFHIWGKDDGGLAIHYHLAIKEKPKVMNTYKVVLTEDEQLRIDNDNGIDYTPDDWRVELYLQGRLKQSLQKRPDIYEQEILDMLPTIYHFKMDNGKIVGEYLYDVTKVNDLKYFIDYLEPVDELYDCSVDLIGGRIYSYQQDKIVKLYNNDVPNVIIVNKDGDNYYNGKIIRRCAKEGQPYANVSGVIYSNLGIGTLGYSAQEVARDLLYQYTDYNSAINFQCIPIYYLEPNTRITVNDKKANVFGDYIIKNISRPLDGMNTMSITAIRALERI